MSSDELVLRVEDMRTDAWAGETFVVENDRVLAYKGARKCIHGRPLYTVYGVVVSRPDEVGVGRAATYCATCDFEAWLIGRRPSERPSIV